MDASEVDDSPQTRETSVATAVLLGSPISADDDGVASTNLLTPKANTISQTDETPVEVKTEIKKPILQSNTPQRSPSLQPISQQIGLSYPLTFANSISAGSGDHNVMPHETTTNPENDESRVSAYARLDFESFTFYVQTLQVLLGRRAENASGMVDVHLGPAKAISRKHAKVFYNFGTQRFELSVLGRNGAFVSDVFVEAGSTIPLKDGTKIQIGQIPFTFVLPSMPAGEESQIKEELDEIEGDGISLDPSREEADVQKRRGSDGAEGTSSITDATSTSVTTNIFETPPPNPQKSERKKKVKKEYKPEEIPPEYREKPQHSYSHLIATALRAHAPPTGISLSDIYKAIQDVFPYYKYCQPGWQNSVRHNLSSSKAFRKVSKEGKGWLWGIDEEYMAEKERQKKKAAAAKAKSLAAAAAAAATNGNSGHHDFRISTASSGDSASSATGVERKPSQTEIPVRKEREKTIAELAAEIQVQRRSSGSNYHTDYASMTRETYKGMKQDEKRGPMSAVSSQSTTFHELADSNNGLANNGLPKSNSIQAQLAASASNRQIRPSIQSVNINASGSQPPITGEHAKTPVRSSNASAASNATLNLSAETLQALSTLQKKIQSQLGPNSGINANVLTNALAIAIAQVAKTGGSEAVTSMLNGKNPAQLAKVLQTALSTAKNSKTMPAQPADRSRSASAEAPASTAGSQTGQGNKPPIASSPSPSTPTATNPTTNPLSSLTGGKPLTAATIAEVLARAKKIANPSASMQAAIQQLQAHADKLRLAEQSASSNKKRPNEEPLETIDNSPAKTVKQN